MKHISCNLCKSTSQTLLFEAHDLLYKTTTETFHVVLCRKCGLVYLNPQPESEELARYYPDVYRPYQAKQKLNHNYTMPEKPTHTVLDLGCGWGDFLLELAKKHPTWGLYGVDFDSRAVEGARRYGFSVHLGAIHNADYPDKFFDEIYMNHVLEHVQNPLETLAECARILKPNGKIIILIPNFRSLSRMLFGKYWYHLDAPRHLYHFTPRTLTAMLTKAGFEKANVSFIPSPKYFLQSFALWKYGKKKSYSKLIWRALALPAKLVSLTRLSSTMRVSAQKLR